MIADEVSWLPPVWGTQQPRRTADDAKDQAKSLFIIGIVPGGGVGAVIQVSG